MADEERQRLSRISTLWTMVFQAHEGSPGTIGPAQAVLLQRYCGAIVRYLTVVVGDRDTADELAQEFALRMIQGKFHHAHPEKGRFRDYLKTCLFNLVREHFRKGKKQPARLDEEAVQPATPATESEEDTRFLNDWRTELLARTWEALEAHEQGTGQPQYTVLRYRTEHPEASSQAMAEELGLRLGKPLTAPAVRQALHRARERFADLLLEETGRSLETTDLDRIEQELIDLELLDYCREAVARRRGETKG